MGKLLRLVFAVWKTGKPLDAERYEERQEGNEGEETRGEAADREMPPESQAAGLKHTAEPARKEVTAACAGSVAQEETRGVAASAPEGTRQGRGAARTGAFVDFAHVKKQLSMTRLLDQVGLGAKLRGQGPQRRCACPIHRGDGRGRTFSVNLEENVFQCFEASCGAKGDVIDLWAALRGLRLRDAALDLVETFGLEAAAKGTEKRHG